MFKALFGKIAALFAPPVPPQPAPPLLCNRPFSEVRAQLDIHLFPHSP